MAPYSFDLHNVGRDTVWSERYEEIYTVEKMMIRREGNPDFLIISKTEKYKNEFTNKDRFKNMVVNNEKFMDTLFEMLSSQNQRILEATWEILSLLPVNKNKRESVQKMSTITDSVLCSFRF